MKEWTSKKIKGLRQRLNLSQTAFGELLGITRIHVYYIEKGVKTPSKTLRLLLDCVEKEKGKGGEKKHGKRHL
jgi:DNA-binding transcriptional regulator YiaG